MKINVTPKRKFLINRLGYIRNRANLSARELSQRLGFSIAYIAKFDNGDFNIPSEVLLDAIDVCDSTPEEFFHSDISKYKEHNNDHQLEIVEEFSKEKLILLTKGFLTGWTIV